MSAGVTITRTVRRDGTGDLVDRLDYVLVELTHVCSKREQWLGGNLDLSICASFHGWVLLVATNAKRPPQELCASLIRRFN